SEPASRLRCGDARALSGQVARPLGGAERIAGNPDKLVALRRIDGPAVGIVTHPERDAARAVRVEVGLAVGLAIVEADVIAPDRVPVAVRVELVAQRARLVRRGEGIFRR